MASLYIWKEVKVRVPTTTVDKNNCTLQPQHARESHVFLKKNLAKERITCYFRSKKRITCYFLQFTAIADVLIPHLLGLKTLLL
jgi:hypothetical protein